MPIVSAATGSDRPKPRPAEVCKYAVPILTPAGFGLHQLKSKKWKRIKIPRWNSLRNS